eukprot:gb/GECG01013346.1/.p1 GENE.gb/GECG01013346.1/~~gb/GECG01013346.1/.p1  ORF type:complete len:599 (+),score=83.85 gb/GECG01013346.1/:1-1797(+)
MERENNPSSSSCPPPEASSDQADVERPVPYSAVPAATETVTIQKRVTPDPNAQASQNSECQGQGNSSEELQPQNYETTTEVLLKYPEGCRTVLKEFVWPHGGDEVKLTGDFVRWGQGLLMEREKLAEETEDDNGHPPRFFLTIPIPANCSIAYKFIVDGQWKYDPQQDWFPDEFGNINNYIVVGSPGMSPEASPECGDRDYDSVQTRDSKTFDAEYGYEFESDKKQPYLYVSPSATLGTLSNLTRKAPPSAKCFQGWIQSQNRWDNCSHSEESTRPKDEVPGPQLSRPFNTGETAGNVASAPSGEQATMRSEGKLVLAMVGLPARGKTYIAKKLKRHLTWLGMKVELFNVGNYRRKLIGSNQSHDFFDPSNRDAVKTRWKLAQNALNEMLDALKSTSDAIDIGIFDATNSTKERRQWLKNELNSASTKQTPINLIFIESKCDDETIIRANVRETKLKSPDYQDIPEDEAVDDFLKRIDHYKKVYEPLDDTERTSYVQLHDVGRKVIMNKMNGFLHGRVGYFLMNVNITPRPIWITRHGESQYNVHGRIGGDSELSSKGRKYGQVLAEFIKEHYPSHKRLVVWTSNLVRAKQTARYLNR